ncbi:MAG: SRPBCC family protein [Mucilaginibacter sp.]
MKNSLLFDFTIDKSTNTVFVKRQFEADQAMVWDAFTKQEILDQWWAPKPWTSRTRHMNFEPGGRRFYAMCSPEGEEHWSVQAYTAITPIDNFKQTSFFTDKDENPNPAMPGSEWDLDFSEAGGVTTVSVTIKHKTAAALETMIKMGFQGGFTMILNYLEQLLSELKK